MKDKRNIWIAIGVALALLEGWALYVLSDSAEQWRPRMIVANEPEAQALYEAMVEAAYQAQTLSYRGICSGLDSQLSAYTVQLKKPGSVRVEVTNGWKVTTVLADGDRLRIFWSGDRPYLKVDDFERYEQTRSDVYVDMAASPNDVINEMARLGVAWSNLIWSPSVFFSGADEFEPYIDGIRYRGTNEVGSEECDVIEVSYFKAQRIRHYWLSREDHLPRRVKEIVRLADNHVIAEDWFGVEVNPSIKKKDFQWSPKDGYRAWNPPDCDEFLLKRGAEAPDFELSSVSGDTIHLADFRGGVVWLCFWQVGWPQCRDEVRCLQSFQEEARDKRLAIVGVNVADDHRIVQTFLRDEAITFPCVLDSSAEAETLFKEGYGIMFDGAPVNFIIGPDGTVVDAWSGYDADHARAAAVLQEVGVVDAVR